MDFHFAIAGGAVGFLVGMTGVGGGSLMAPILVLLFSVNPSLAVGTDLWFAAITKSVGGMVHRRVGSPDWTIVKRLAWGSVPAATLTLIWLGTTHSGKLQADLLMKLLGGALIFSAAVMPFKGRLMAPLETLRERVETRHGDRLGAATVICGAMVGVLVALTSVGAGAIVAVVLMLLYHGRLNTHSLVGTDIVHAIPLALVAAIGHLIFGNVDWWLLGGLLVGSIPGIVLGSLMAGRISETWLRGALSVMLAFSGYKLLTH
ncbi:hypothetical protein SAMN05518801_13222 [Novosphingobium sp. CF614]|uniref:sulfite exporter TauE/SafE family protein n=1 Tax=Novosphingobium sp. CF614 TaxID=1884364 RepID=UPI0008F1FC16|nr:sulfite exporter TauE/SafE family protein [Novosphingobium sp. CF614]SFG47945.1 hypothetical protein SAMN05518801_13222 [Novosphingobium sp. CF614]